MIPDFKTFIKESIWSDMQDRSAGEIVRKEDDNMEVFKKYLETLNLDSEKIKIIEGKSINIKVKDKYIEQNDGVFKISILNNKINVEKVDEAYDIELNINSIAQLAFSYLNIDEILMLNEIDENSLSYDQKNILNILFEKKTNYIDELV